MYAYPTTFPKDEIQCLVGYVGQRTGTLTDAVHAGWVVVGFALSQLPVPSAVAGARLHARVLDEATALAHLQKTTSAGAVPLSGIPWQDLLVTVLSWLSTWL